MDKYVNGGNVQSDVDRSFLSSISKPFAFDEYFEELIKNSKALNLLATNENHEKSSDEAKTKKVQKRARNRERAAKLSTSQIMSKVSSCFICGEQFDFNALNEHEKSCLENIKSNDVQYTRQNTDEQVSSISSKAESLSLSNNSNRSSSSNEPSEKAKLGRCYICGDDIPIYLRGIHEKSCKKNWESGLLNSDRRTSVRADVFRSLSRSGSRADVSSNEIKSGNLRKSKSTTLYRGGSCANSNNISRDSIDVFKTPIKKSSNSISKSSTDISKCATNLRKSTSNLSTSNSNLEKKREPLKNGGVNGHFASTLRSSYSSQSDISNPKVPPNRSISATPIRNYRSISNLKQDTSNKSTNKLTVPLDKTKSLQDLRKTSPSDSMTSNLRSKSPTDKKRGGGGSVSPQYVVCHLCGKLYSQHSIMIHVKQCEKTIDRQKTVGTNVEYRIKSQSLADLRKGKTSNGAIGRSPSSITPVLQKSKQTNNKSADGANHSPSLSSSMDNSAQKMTKRQEGPESESKENIPSTDVSLDRNDSVESDSSVSTPGLQKCYLCGQLYGTRSLPIHQKQCYLKQERLREAETNTKKKKKREIKVIPFGKSKYPDSTTKQPSSPPRFFQFPSRAVGRSSSSATSPPRATSVDSLFSRTDSELSKDSDKESIEQTEFPRRLGSSESSSGNESISPTSFKDVMMTCVHCGCQCEPYTMTIHEKVCRKVALDDVMVTSPELSIGEGSPSGEEISRRGLICCEGCGGEFSSTDIFQHRINCRTSVL